MQDDDFSANQSAIKSSAYSFLPSASQLKQPLPHCPRMRHSQIDTVLLHKANQTQKISVDANWPAFDVLLNPRVEVVD
jgi:hypothetical protein